MPGERNQSFTITYNGYSVGGSSGRPIHGSHALVDGYTIARLNFDFIMRGFATREDLNTAADAAEEAFRVPRADCTILNGTGAIKTLSHSGNTGFDADPTISKVGDDKFDSSWSRKYHVEIAFGRPANNVSTSGRRTSQVHGDFSPSRVATITIEGEYTAIPSGAGTARDQYDSAIAAYVTSVMTLFGITNYDLIDEKTVHNETNKTLQFTRVMRELIHAEGGSTSDAEIVAQNIETSVLEEAPGDTPPAKRVVKLGVSFDCWINKDLNTNLVGKWDSLLSWLVQEAQNSFGGGAVGLTLVERRFDWMNNRIVGRLELQGIGSDILTHRITTRDYIVTGQTLDPAWVAPLSKYLFQGERKIQRTITETFESYGGGGGGGAGGGAGGGGNVGIGGGGFAGPGIGVVAGGFGGGVGFGPAGQAPQVLFNGQGGGGGGGGAQAGAGNGVPAIPPEAQGCEVSIQTISRTVTPLRKGLNGYSFDTTEWGLETMMEFFIPVAAPEQLTVTG